MPNMDGFELTAAVRSEERGERHIPIIAVTANAMTGESQRCLDGGMDDYLSKPLRLGELKVILDKRLPVTSGVASCMDKIENNQCVIKNVSAEYDFYELAVWDASVLPGLLGDNPRLHKRLLEIYLTSSKPQLEVLIGSEDPVLIAQTAHKLKSSARSVGALRLGGLCQALETEGRAGNMTQCNVLIKQLRAYFDEVSQAITAHLTVVKS
jgi:CheY-like chemotaxis protein